MAETYLRYAAEAEAEAARAVVPERRLRLLDLAEGWRAMAERVRTLSGDAADRTASAA